jgi:hypothetical protein
MEPRQVTRMNQGSICAGMVERNMPEAESALPPLRTAMAMTDVIAEARARGRSGEAGQRAERADEGRLRDEDADDLALP